MMKTKDPNDTYVVQELFGCGAGHFLTDGFTHWEEGECCPHTHDEGEDSHLYYRKFWVPTETSDGRPMDEYYVANPGKWGQLPLVIEGK